MSEILRIMIAMLVWLILFSAVYALHGIGCAAGWSGIVVNGATVFRVAITAAFCMALLGQVGVLVALRSSHLRSASPFVASISETLAIAALVAVAWSLFPAFVLSACN